MAQFRFLASTCRLFRKRTCRCVIDFSRRYSGTHVKYTQSVSPLTKLSRDDIDFKESSNTDASLNFDNYTEAYRAMSTFELARAITILRLCSYNCIVDRSLQMMAVGRKLLGRKLFNRLMKATVYGQFVGGDSVKTFQLTANKLRNSGLGLIIAVCIEEDISDNIQQNEEIYDRNLQTIIESLNRVASLENKHPMMQIKLTAIFPSKLCVSLSQMFPEPSSMGHIVEQMASLIQTGDRPNISGLTDVENSQLHSGLGRIKTLCHAAVDKGVILMVDAEYSYMNPGLNLFSLAMMLVCNTNKSLVYYTYQNYLKNIHSLLVRDIDFIRGHGVGFGTKLVRGAYIDKERLLARTQGYPDPINDTFEATSEMYNRSMETMLQHIAKHPTKFSAIIATHNEETVQLAVNRITSLGIDTSGGSIFFGQVYGMCDHVSYTLSDAGMPIYKSLPYGSVENAIPYLSRRAMENRSVLQRSGKERGLMWQAFKARMY